MMWPRGVDDFLARCSRGAYPETWGSRRAGVGPCTFGGREYRAKSRHGAAGATDRVSVQEAGGGARGRENNQPSGEEIGRSPRDSERGDRGVVDYFRGLGNRCSSVPNQGRDPVPEASIPKSSEDGDAVKSLGRHSPAPSGTPG